MAFRGYIFDLDGTLYRGNEAIPYAVDSVRSLSDQGALIRYVTNNSTQTREYFAEKLSRMGFPATHHQVVSSASGTAEYLVSQGLESAYVVGESGLGETLTEYGIQVTEDSNVDAVVVGLCRHFSYDLMNEAMQRIRAGAKFVATNPDVTFPQEGGRFTPGAGSIVAAIQACSQTAPVIVGKPHPFLITATLAAAGLSPHECLVVGDRMDTDIDAGRAAGCPTFLVLTGVETVIPVGQAGSEDLRTLVSS